MSTVSDITRHVGRGFRWFIGWPAFLLCSAGAVTLLAAGRVYSYLQGRYDQDQNAFDPISLLTIVAFLFLLGVILMLSVRWLYRMMRGKDSWWQSLLLPLPWLALVVLQFVPIPSFLDGVEDSLREHTTSAEFVSLAKSVKMSPPAWLGQQQAPNASEQKAKWLGSVAPLNRLALSQHPLVEVRQNTLELRWGGPLAKRWGILVSATPGVKPEIPSHASSCREIYPEVWIYTIFS